MSTTATCQPGQILLRGPSVMAGYHNNPEATTEALSQGWLHTGDIGVLDEDGYLKIVDRARDMLISGGLNVYPAEIEAAIAGLPGLEECAVIGVPDDRWGEVPDAGRTVTRHDRHRGGEGSHHDTPGGLPPPGMDHRLWRPAAQDPGRQDRQTRDQVALPCGSGRGALIEVATGNLYF